MGAPEPESRPAPVPDRPLTGEAGSIPAGDVRETVRPKELTPEEQMAEFEKDLKENDWGHQPC